MEEIYVSTDIETDGPIPGEYSMLSFGSAAFVRSSNLGSAAISRGARTPIATFYKNLECLPGAKQDMDTMLWWSQNKEAWDAHRVNTISPNIAMVEYMNWLNGLPGKPVFVGYPAGFDFTFIYWYLIKFAGFSPFGFSAIDIKSYAMAKLGSDFRKTTKRSMPKHWFGPTKHTHIALDDAIGQGELFMNMLG